MRLLLDQDFNQNIIRGLRRRVPDLDAVNAFEAGLSEAPDPMLLEYAARAGRVVVSHDRRTMPGHAAKRIAEGEPMSGVLIVPRRMSLHQVIDELQIIVTCSLENDWVDTVRYLPL